MILKMKKILLVLVAIFLFTNIETLSKETINLTGKDSTRMMEFSYNGKTYRGEAVEVTPAIVKIKSDDGRIGNFYVDHLNIEFAATLDIPNSPYKKLYEVGNRVSFQSPITTIPSGVQPQAKKESTQNPIRKGLESDSNPNLEKSKEPADMPCMYERRNGLATVGILSMKVAPVKYINFYGKEITSSDSRLQILLRIKNNSPTRKLSYNTWRTEFISTGDASLKDNLGNKYKEVGISMAKPVHGIERESIYPGKSIVDILLFEAPIEVARTMTLQLKGTNIKQKHPFKFTFPVKDIEK